MIEVSICIVFIIILFCFKILTHFLERDDGFSEVDPGRNACEVCPQKKCICELFYVTSNKINEELFSITESRYEKLDKSF